MVVEDSSEKDAENRYLKECINAAVDASFQVSTFRSSIGLKDALKHIVESQVVPHLNDYCSQASFNTRVGALMKLSVSFLCMPRLSTLLGFGLIPTQNEGYEISRRLKACVTEMLLILVLVGKSNLTEAPDTLLDCRRIELLVELVLLRRSLLIPFVITMTESCPEALMHMSCHILVVSALADDILETINIVTKKIRNLLNKDLSLTTSSTKEILKSEFSRYFTWLRLHQEGLRKICRNNEIFCSVDKSVKAWLKGEEYESPAQLLARYNQKYKSYLTNMNVPLQAFRMEDVRQAVKDVKRDSIVLNDVRYSSHDGVCRRNVVRTEMRNRKDSSSIDTIENVDLTNFSDRSPHNSSDAERQECLVHAIVQELCTSLSAKSQLSMTFAVITNNDNSFSVKNCRPNKTIEETNGDCSNEKTDILNDTIPEPSEESSLEFEKISCDRISTEIPSISTSSYLNVENISGDSFEEISTCNKNVVVRNFDPGSMSEHSPSSDCSAVSAGTSISWCGIDRATSGLNSPTKGAASLGSAYTTSFTSIRLHESLLEMLLNQVLLAASRTTAGGDAFLILENLYGGEGLLFSPRSYKTQSQGNALPRKESKEGIFSNFISDYEQVVVQTEDKAKRKRANYSGIEIEITPAGIEVVLKEQYNLLLKESLEQNMELSLPLISFECTTTTLISFPSNSNTASTYDLYSKLLYNTEKICQRTISIEPLIFK